MDTKTEYNYDVFISYAEADCAWVKGYLLDALGEAGVRCHSEAAFALGAPRLLEFERAIQESRRTLLVLSLAYLAEESNQFIDLLAQTYSLEKSTWQVIPLKREQVELPTRLGMLTFLDASDSQRWSEVIARLCHELQRSVPEPSPRPTCPYPGLAPFNADNARFFFGRNDEIDTMLRLLRHHRFLLVIGPSGSGKSSLIQAGLLTRLRASSYFSAENWLIRTMRPGNQPLQTLSETIDTDVKQSSGQHLLLVIDQFEEIFAQIDLNPAQNKFITKLQGLRSLTHVTIILGLRADFYDRLMLCELWPVAPSELLYIDPLKGADLRDAIVQPATLQGVYLDASLVERLLAEAAIEPGVLPLVQETMVLLWGEMKRRLISLDAYKQLCGDEQNGLAVALKTAADAMYDRLSFQQQKIARRIFLRLVQFAPGREAVRRQQSIEELRAVGDDNDVFGETLRYLIQNRLLTASGKEEDKIQKIDLAHEALIKAWPRFQGWLTERGDAEQIRRRLEEKTKEWHRLKGNGGLLDAVQLREAEEWLQSPDAIDVGYDAALPALVAASRTAQAETADKARRTVRYQWIASVAIVGLIIGVLIIALVSARQLASKNEAIAIQSQENEKQQAALAVEADKARKTAEVERADALTARATAVAERDRAEQLARSSRSGALAAQSQVVLEKHPQLGLLLAAEAVNVTLKADEPRVLAAEAILRTGLANSAGYGLSGHAGPVTAVAISSDHHWLVTGSVDKTAHLWDLTTGDAASTPIILGGHTSEVTSVAISPDNHWLVTVSGDHPWQMGYEGGDNVARLWDLTASDPASTPIVLNGHDEGINAVAISADSHWLVTGSSDKTARLWDLTAPDPAAMSIVLRGHESSIWAVAIGSDGHWLVTGGGDNTARLWDLTAADPAKTAIILNSQQGWVIAVAISPNHHWLITVGADQTAHLWNLTVSDPSAVDPIILSGHTDFIYTVAISPNSHWLVTGSGDNTARLWDLTAPDPASAPIVLHGHEGPIYVAAISPDDHWLVTGAGSNIVSTGFGQIKLGEDFTARLWDLTYPGSAIADTSVILRGHEGSIRAAAISADNTLVTTSDDSMIRLWKLPNASAAPVVLRGHQGAGINAVAVSPNGNWLATGGDDSTVRLWPLAAPDPAVTSIGLGGHESSITTVAISSDNHWLVTGSWDSTVRLWDLTARDPAIVPIVLKGHESSINAAAISSDNRWLVTGSQDTTVRLWDLTALDPTIESIILWDHEQGISTVAVSANNHWLAAGSYDSEIRLWNLAAPGLVDPLVLRGHEGGINGITAIAFSLDNRWLFSGSSYPDNKALLWDLTAPDPSATPISLPGHEDDINTVTFSPDDHWLVTGSADTIVRLWDLTAPDLAVTAPIVLHGHEQRITAMAISLDSHWLLTGSEDTTARVWDLTDLSRSPIVLSGHAYAINAVTISPDNRWLVTASLDDTARLWPLKMEQLVYLACRTAGRNLSREEWEQYFPEEEYRKTCE